MLIKITFTENFKNFDCCNLFQFSIVTKYAILILIDFNMAYLVTKLKYTRLNATTCDLMENYCLKFRTASNGVLKNRLCEYDSTV